MFNEIIHSIMKSYKLNYCLDDIPPEDQLDDKDKVIYELINEHANDLNSSSYREEMTALLCGYNKLYGKLGYDAEDKEGNKKEIKPKNCIFDKSDLEEINIPKLNYTQDQLLKLKKKDLVDILKKNGMRASGNVSPLRNRILYPTIDDFPHKKNNIKNRLNGSGNFSDMTHARIKKHYDDNINMIISGFANGQCMYIIEFPFKEESFMERITTQVEKSRPNSYCRSAGFTFKHYKDIDVKIKFISENITKYYRCFNQDFYIWLKNKNQVTPP